MEEGNTGNVGLADVEGINTKKLLLYTMGHYIQCCAQLLSRV